MRIKDKLLETPLIYSAWTASPNKVKMEGIRRLLPSLANRRVLDIGCGPASNTELFLSCEYTGIDINQKYIQEARKLFPVKNFIVQDVRNLKLAGAYDLIIINSFLHHINNDAAKQLFGSIRNILSEKAIIILSEPIRALPSQLMRLSMMKLDRGKFFRSFEEYCSLFPSWLHLEKTYPYPLKIFGLMAWDMMVFRLSNH